MKFRTLLLLLPLLLTACAQQPKQDYDPGYSFAKLQKFTPLPISSSDDPLSAERINQAIVDTLKSKQFIEVTESADFKVSFAFRTTDKPKDKGLSIGLGSGTWGSGGGIGVGGVPLGADAKLQTIQIDIIEATSNRLIWRGSDQFSFSDGGEGKAQATRETVMRILSQFPPQP
ncbi:DUF4136 domain-containing protein [Shewanella algae]|uniref:DUF4136 domain-containing protein n=1 Tax=Shewanella algae TaxID=38313 RepID=UPI003984CC8B